MLTDKIKTDERFVCSADPPPNISVWGDTDIVWKIFPTFLCFEGH